MRVGVLVTSYNDDPEVINSSLKSIYEQTGEDDLIVCVDDGSTVPVKDLISFRYDTGKLRIARIPHGERCKARMTGLQLIRAAGCEYFLFLDSDMVLSSPKFLDSIIQYSADQCADAIVIPEEAFSTFTNYWSRVKVFERNLYQAGQAGTRTSIEAARFWKLNSFPGFMQDLNAFEEIQPTLRLLEQGGRVCKFTTPLKHDEKYVTLASLMRKKNHYFSEIRSHQKVKLKDMLQRYYFFRTQLYHKSNLKNYVLHPLLTMGVITMYMLLTLSGIMKMGKMLVNKAK